MPSRKVTSEIYDRMKELRSEGYKNTEISKIISNELEDGIDISVSTVRAYLEFGSASEMTEYYARRRGFISNKDYNDDVDRRRSIRIEAWRASFENLYK